MRRRNLLLGFAAAPIVGTAAQAKQKAMPVIAWIGFKNNTAHAGLQQGLRDLGYVEGQNLTIRYLFTDQSDVGFAGPVAEIGRRKVDIIAAAGFPAAVAVRQLASSIPVVFVAADPVGAGLAASLAHPGGNMTGVSLAVEEQFSGKWLELIKEAAPQSSRVDYVWNPTNHSSASSWKTMQSIAPKLRMTLGSVEMRTPEALSQALSQIGSDRADALVLDSDAVTGLVQSEITDFARSNRLPLISVFRRVVDAGGLMSYGPNLRALWRHAAIYIDKILKGAKPADLPVEQPTAFELVVNLKTAKAIGLALPQSLLSRADELIE